MFILFSGHMIDKAGRAEPRFPAEKEGAAAVAIREAVVKVVEGAGGVSCRGIAAAACGGDILFHEACQAVGVPSVIYLGIPVDEFEKTSVAFAGEDWVRRYRRLVGELRVEVLFPEETAEAGDEVWEKANEWMLKTASGGEGGMALIVLWDGKGGDGKGGTRHMVEVVEKKGGRVTVIDTEKLGG